MYCWGIIPLQLSHFFPLRDVHCVDNGLGFLLCLLHLLQHLETDKRTKSNLQTCAAFITILILDVCKRSSMTIRFSILTLLFFLAFASATRLIGRALISFHFCLYSSTISLVTGTGLCLCFRSSSRNHSGTSQDCSELANL